MGILWALLDRNRRVAFELGKGNWPELLCAHGIYVQEHCGSETHTWTREGLYPRHERCRGLYDILHHRSEKEVFAIVRFIRESGHTVELANDTENADAEDESDEFPIVGSVYDEPGETWYWTGPRQLDDRTRLALAGVEAFATSLSGSAH